MNWAWHWQCLFQMMFGIGVATTTMNLSAWWFNRREHASVSGLPTGAPLCILAAVVGWHPRYAWVALVDPFWWYAFAPVGFWKYLVPRFWRRECRPPAPPKRWISHRLYSWVIEQQKRRRPRWFPWVDRGLQWVLTGVGMLLWTVLTLPLMDWLLEGAVFSPVRFQFVVGVFWVIAGWIFAVSVVVPPARRWCWKMMDDLRRWWQRPSRGPLQWG